MLDWIRLQLAGTLRRRLVVSVAAVHAVLMAGFVWDLTLRQQALLLESQVERTQVLAESLAAASPTELAARDLAGLVENVEAIGGFQDLTYAMVLDRDGRVLAHTDAGRIGQFVHDLPGAIEPALLVRTEALVDAVAPVKVGRQHVGWARVGMRQGRAQAQLQAIVQQGVAYALGAILVGSVFAAWVGRHLTRRLQRIQAVADAVERGDPTRRAALPGTDEAAGLSRAFDRMLDVQAAARKALADSEQRLIVAMEAASMVAWHWEIDADRTTWGAERERLLGPPPVGGYPDYRQMVVPEDREAFLVAGRAAMAGQSPYAVEYRLRRTDGQVVWLLTQGRVVRADDGAPVAMTGVTQDISVRKRSEELLRQSEARAGVIFDNSPDALLIVDKDGRILRVNGRGEQLFDYPAQELLGRSVETLMPIANRERHVDRRDDFLRKPEARRMSSITVMALRRNGVEFPAAINLAPMVVGDELQVIASVRDETHDKALEAELILHRDHLEEVVAMRTAELTVARNDAERLARAKSEFLAHMSHEIRTPLNAVIGLAQIGAREGNAQAVQELFEGILQAGQHLLGVIDDILDFSKIDAGKLVIERRPFALGAVLDSASAFVSGAARHKGLQFEVSTAPGMCADWASGDARRLRQILVNLLANAVKFTQRGSVRLRVAREGEDIYFKIVDEGIGMSPAQVARLFQPFEQGDASTTRRYGGSGLGLAISRNLAHLMGGEITVESSPGAGSAFTLRLPLPVVEADMRPRVLHIGPRLVGLCILAADDLEVNRMILEALLTHEGASVVLVADGLQALDRLQGAGAADFDVVLMDVQMPVMDGIEAARRIRQIAPMLPIIALTAHALDTEREKCRAAGMVEHVTKPIVPDELVAAILRHATPAV